jgi:RHS repeat-associated protein
VSGHPNRAYAQVINETNANTGNITDYLYGDDLIKQTQAANDRYYLYDGLGSTRALSDSTGTITDTYNYESFGTVLNQTGTTPNDYLFTGEQYDSGLDNYYLRARYYDQNIGRFTQQDTWMGNNSDPITLHKYLYANVDPVNNIDPTGNFTLASFGAAESIRSILNEITVNTGVSIFDSAFSGDDGGDISPTAAGWGIIASLSPGILKPLAKKLKSKFFGNGKVAYLKDRKPLPKEIDAAEFLAEKQGAKIFIRGGKGTQGADFFLDGVRWELKTLDSPSARAVRNGIYKSIKRNQSKLVVIDGRVGLDWKTFQKGLANAQRDGAHPARVKVIMPGNIVRDWP